MLCAECGQQTEWDDSVCSRICTHCGTLVDAQQALLSHDAFENSTNTSSRAPLKSLRTGWSLHQDKSTRDARHLHAHNTFIASILNRLSHPGHAARAQTLFSLAMEKTASRWGRKAKLLAGASIAIALREAHTSTPLHDLAQMLDVSPPSLSRTLSSLISTLNFTLDPLDPSAHFPLLISHLRFLLEANPPQLPADLVKRLAGTNWIEVSATGSALAALPARIDPDHSLLRLPTPPTACALLILALEAEARTPIPSLEPLEGSLASRYALSQVVVGSRYRALSDLILLAAAHVPWLDSEDIQEPTSKKRKRAKVPRRLRIARIIKDTLQFHALPREEPHFDIDLNKSNQCSLSEDDETETEPPRKKRRKPDLDSSKSFLLNPLSSDLPPSPPSSPPRSPTRPYRPPSGLLSACTLLSTSPTRAPTRSSALLRLLNADDDAEVIPDDLLFAPGELDSVFRSQAEQEALAPLFRLEWGEDDPENRHDTRGPGATKGASRKAGAQREKPEKGQGSSKINMDAFNELMATNSHDDDDDDGNDDIDFDCLDDDAVAPGAPLDTGLEDEEADEWSSGDRWLPPSNNVRTPPRNTALATTDEEEVLEAWRPLTPSPTRGRSRGGAMGWGSGAAERYDEEY
ncbi:hypothetical protein CONPUDRAFT_97552 [Coniophora puteana RWD-64-598 SS2]|uniref:Uncharacterized protein n=1 Tax=Coniophora puteana (strain RWD-64-598) TaxID=741705 RepID=A0A5M3N127_CONPW|nr:uncharacterized protein CONPUDRAFT_97552 [Coniophora puteana RWD-64-598 SS2]EIW84996.1 hypothetical protein CONPUDRAFT_97552 [Coniophora puteana RWD-64-598 SS2]